jgi:nucleoside-diphosphate-sugar epimerase
MEKILVIGGSGYIGSEFCKFLTSKNLQVDCLDKGIYGNNFSIKKLKKKKNFKFLCQDLRNFKPKSDYEKVVIFAGLVGDPITKKYPILSNSINVIGIKKIIKFFCNKKIKLIFISTCSNYGFLRGKIADEKTTLNPKSLYAKQKVEIENYIMGLKKKSLFQPIILRFATAFGISDRPRFDLTINEFVLNAFLKKNFEIYDHETWRPYCHIKDFCMVIFKFLNLKKKLSFQIFNVGSNKNNLRKIDIAIKIKKLLPNFKYKIIHTSKDPRNYIVNFKKISKLINTKKFLSVNSGIKELIKYLNNYKNLYRLLKSGNYHIKI